MSASISGVQTQTLLRPRLVDRIVGAEARPVTLVVAPAGFGKTTLLAHAAERGGLLRLAAQQDSTLRWIDLPPTGPVAVSISDLPELHRSLPPGAVLVLDDAQFLADPAGTVLGLLITQATGERRVVVASRRRLPLEPTSARFALELGPNALRFRFWEVDELFRSCYRDPLPPEVAAVLARRTAGWIAYLHLFHLATTRRPLPERVGLLESLANRPWLLRDHLAQHVLASLPGALQAFLLETCVLPLLTIDLCDALRQTSGSHELLTLAEAERLVIEQVAEAGVYQYHPIIRLHLESELAERFGHAEAARRYRRAAELLEAAGLPEAALSCYAKANAWEEVRRLAPRHPGRLGDLHLRPTGVDEQDPLVLLARARRELDEGRFRQAAQAFRSAAERSESPEVARLCLDSARVAERWATPEPTLGLDAVSILRAATIRDPARARRDAAAIPGAEGALVEALAAILAGAVDEGLRLCERVQWSQGASPRSKAAASVAAFMIWLAQSRPIDADVLDAIDDQVTAADWPWLERMLSGMVALTSAENDAMAVVEAWRVEEDPWGEGLLSLMAGSVTLARGLATDSLELLQRSLAVFDRLRAGTFQAWAQWLVAVALSSTDHSPEVLHAACLEAERLGEACAMPFVATIGRLVWARATGAMPPGDVGPVELQSAGLRAFGFAARALLLEPDRLVGRPPSTDVTPIRHAAPSSDIAWLRCLGSFGLGVGESVLDPGALKPKERLVLGILAARAGTGVHREELIEALWPEAPLEPALRRLQVAISAIRTRMDQCFGDDDHIPSPELRRIGDGYCLWFPETADVDLWRFAGALQRALLARRQGDTAGETAALGEALDCYAGPLLPEAGPTDWVVAERAQLQNQASDAAERLGTLLIEAGTPSEALTITAVALGHDRYRDGLWKLQIEAAELAGRPAEAEQARRGYLRLLNELGLSK